MASRTPRDIPSASGEPVAAKCLIRVVLTLTVAVFLVSRAMTIRLPLERDEGEYAYIAQRMLLGELPYRDVFNQKPPGVFLAYLPVVALFEPSVVAIHLTLAVCSLVTMIGVFVLVRELFNRVAAAFAVLVFAILSIEPTWLATAANTEQFMLLPMVWSAVFAQRAVTSASRRAWLFCGALAAAACFCKQVAATHVSFLILWAIGAAIRDGAIDIRALRRLAVWFPLGFAAVIVPVSAYFAFRGGFHDYLECVVLHNLRYADYVPLQIGLEQLGGALGRQWPSLLVVWILTVFGIAGGRGDKPGRTLLVALWLGLSAVGVSIGLYFREHYFLQLAPAMAIAAGATLARLSRRLGAVEGGTRRAVGVALLAAATVILPPAWHHRAFWIATPEQQARLLYDGNPFPESETIARRIAEVTAPTDRVLIVGSEPQILFFAKRASATRHILFYPLMMDLPGAAERQREVIADVERAPPPCILMTNFYSSLLIAPGAPLHIFEALVPRIEAEYVVDALRVFQDGEYRFVVGEEAAQRYELAKSGEPIGSLDMFVFLRRS
ncbi:MAG: glycosyltransferase family 39 protein [Phycisphaerae bacterium]|nr:glycosyltransferase family 39 protein [Phycisphaerae bacterium]